MSPTPPGGVSDDDVDGWNARFAAARKGASVTELLLELNRSHETFLRAAAAVPAERFQPGKTAWRIVDGNSAHHYKEHGDAWRAAKGLCRESEGREGSSFRKPPAGDVVRARTARSCHRDNQTGEHGGEPPRPTGPDSL